MKTNERNKKNSLYLAQGAIIAALYVAITVPFSAIAFGPVQFRVSEALVILPYFTPAAIPGVTIGCFLSNLICGAPIPDVVFGPIATLIGAVGSYMLRRHRYAVWVPPVLSNALIIPWVLKYAYGSPDLVPYMMLTVGLGEVLAVGILGNLLMVILEKNKGYIFKRQGI